VEALPRQGPPGRRHCHDHHHGHHPHHDHHHHHPSIPSPIIILTTIITLTTIIIIIILLLLTMIITLPVPSVSGRRPQVRPGVPVLQGPKRPGRGPLGAGRLLLQEGVRRISIPSVPDQCSIRTGSVPYQFPMSVPPVPYQYCKDPRDRAEVHSAQAAFYFKKG
jgi:hypothetical protein